MSPPKDFGPNSLTSFVLKTFERLGLRVQIRKGCLSDTLHTYCKGRSEGFAPHTIVKDIEESLYQKKFAVGAFLDVEGTLNNVLPEAIPKSLHTLRVAANLIRFIYGILSDIMAVTA